MVPSPLAQYSRPSEKYDSRISTEIAVSYASELIKIFVESQGHKIMKNSTGVIDFICRAIDEGLSFEQVWDHSLGGIESIFEGSEYHDEADVAARIALHLASESKSGGTFKSSLSERGRVKWKGWLLPVAEAMEFEGDGHSANIILQNDREYMEYQFVNDYITEGIETVTALPQVGLNGSITLFPARSIIISSRAASRLEEPMEIIGENVSNIFNESIEILDCYALRYRRWVLEIVRGILCYPRLEGQSFSGSWTNLPGTIHMSMLDEPLQICSVLIHEASHQYFNLVSCIVDYVDGQDNSEYYSPTVKKPRPLDRILMAYHAFANVVLFYRECEMLGILRSEHCKRQFEQFITYVEQLDEPLRGNKSLTNAGFSLYAPLARAISS